MQSDDTLEQLQPLPHFDRAGAARSKKDRPPTCSGKTESRVIVVAVPASPKDCRRADVNRVHFASGQPNKARAVVAGVPNAP